MKASTYSPKWASALKISVFFSLIIPFTAQAQTFSKGQICMAVIAVEMGRPVESISIIEQKKNPIVSYRRADDGKRFTFNCRISEKESSVVWRGYFPEEKQWGRWRDQEYDAKIKFTLSRDSLTVLNNQLGNKTFTINQF